jgi:tetratricopeptide (TPR) repeat protein
VLDPHNLPAIEMAAMIDAAQGHLAAARARIAQAPQSIDRAALAAQFAAYWDLVWMLDESQQQAILRATPKTFFDDRGIWGLVLAQTLWLHGEQGLAGRYADSARAALIDHVREAPDDDQQHLLLGLSLAYLGRKREAVREGLRGLALAPVAKNALYGPYNQHLLARIYLLVGEPGKALDNLEELLKLPYFLSAAWLKIDPTFEQLRGDPRFERLVAGAE